MADLGGPSIRSLTEGKKRAMPERELPLCAEAGGPGRKPQVTEGPRCQGPGKPPRGRWLSAFVLSEMESLEGFVQRKGLSYHLRKNSSCSFERRQWGWRWGCGENKHRCSTA